MEYLSAQEIPEDGPYGAAARGDVEGLDPESVSVAGGPRGWVPLLYLCYSPWLTAESHVEAGRWLLERGADARAGFWNEGWWQNAIYGAGGRAFNVELSRLLLAFGADPNDEETPYHVPESYDPRLLSVFLESGKLSAESLTTMLLRKADMHDLAGVRTLLEFGVDPNRETRWCHTPFEQALRRDNSLETLRLFLEHGAVPGEKALDLACRRGRGDLLAFLGVVPARADGRCALGLAAEGALENGAELLAQFAGNGNVAGVASLLRAGVAVDGLYAGDGYFGIAPQSTALHVAAWRGHSAVVEALLEAGAAVGARDGWGRSPLQLAVKACVDSYWMSRRGPESVRALLAAGAVSGEIGWPTGYAAIDDLLSYGRTFS